MFVTIACSEHLDLEDMCVICDSQCFVILTRLSFLFHCLIYVYDHVYFSYVCQIMLSEQYLYRSFNDHFPLARKWQTRKPYPCRFLLRRSLTMYASPTPQAYSEKYSYVFESMAGKTERVFTTYLAQLFL